MQNAFNAAGSAASLMGSGDNNSSGGGLFGNSKGFGASNHWIVLYMERVGY